MTETATILQNATDRSLVLMDEIGRGTSTFDGLSLAWACAEHLANHIHALCLFATHYFEITTLPDQCPNAHNVHLSATEHNDGIVFLYNIKPGPASQSYGLQVAKLAGIPQIVIDEARLQLSLLEKGQHTHSQHPPNTEQNSVTETPHPQQTELFNSLASPALEALKKVEADDLTPKQALEFIYHLKQLSR